MDMDLCGAQSTAFRSRPWRIAPKIILWVLGAISCFLLPSAGQAQTFGCTPAMANDIVCENSKSGAPSSDWAISGVGDSSIQGFATDISFNQGQTVFFKIETDAASYHLDIYRMGYYNGNGARLITTVNPSASLPQVQPACINDAATKLYDCGNWAVSASWTVPANATSGIYFARVVRTDTGGASHIFFIVRNDASHSDVLYQTPDATWQAYNSYGGPNLYGSGVPMTFDVQNRAYKASYNRPFYTEAFAPVTWVFADQYPMVRWLEANGYDVTYYTDLDSDRGGALIKNHKVFVSSGHDEYWSGGQRTNVEAARDAGVNLAFFGGNDVFWKTRWENSIDGSGTPNRTLVSYKETLASAKLDPADPPTWTGTWRDPTFSPPADGGRPENALMGTFFEVNKGSDNTALSIQVPSADGKMRFWRNTSVANLTAGNTATLPSGTLGYEWDVADDNGFRPAGLINLSTTTQNLTASYLLDYGGVYGTGVATHHLTLYRASSGALVFGAGTVQWSWGLDNQHSNDLGYATPTPSPDMQQATVNLFADMGVQAATIQGGLLPATKSTDATPPVSTITSPAPGAALNTGALITITGTALDAGGGTVGGVEVSVDGGQTWHPASGRANWLFSFTLTGPTTLKSRAVDDSGNIEIPGPGVTITVTGGTAGQTLFTTQTPALINQSDGAGVDYELGTAFTSTTAGRIAAIRFWKAPNESGTHSGKVWSNTGTLLASVTFGADTASGWQQQSLPAPISIAANTTYIVSVNTANSYYAATDNGLATQVMNGSLASIVGNNGLFGSTGQFPTSSYQRSNYFRDIVFVPNMTYSISGAISPSANSSGATVTLSGAASAATTVDAFGNYTFTGLVNGNYTITPSKSAFTFVPTSTTVTVTSVNVTGANFSLTANQPPAITSANNVTFGVGVAGAFTVTASGFPAATISANGTLPAGVSFNASTGVLSGTAAPGTAGSYPITFTAQNGVVPDATQSFTLAVVSASISSVQLNPSSIVGGNSSTGTVALSAPAPAAGALVSLSTDKPVLPGIEGVSSSGALPQSSALAWSTLGAEFSLVNSGTAIPVPGQAGVNFTISTATGQPMELTTNCSFGGNCSWYGNFADSAYVLWVNGTYYSDTGWWAPNGPLAIAFSSPQRGFGFQMMGDESGPFTATLCAYNASDTQLGCVPFKGNGTGTADGSAAFVGLYDDALEITRVTIDGGGQLYPHDFGVSSLFVTATRRPIVPDSVTVPAGGTSANFPISTDSVSAAAIVNITATYGGTRTAQLTINPAALSSMTLKPSVVTGGTSLTGTGTLSGTAPPGGVMVALSADNPVAVGMQTVNDPTGMSQDGLVTWTDFGPSFTSINSGSSFPVSGISDLTLTAATNNNLPLMILTACPALAGAATSFPLRRCFGSAARTLPTAHGLEMVH
jgi:hypothetical protein